MLKNEFVKIKTKGCRKLPYFESLGYNISGESININIIHLNKGSRQLINVICDYCGKEVSIFYKEYLRNISISNKYACSITCGSEKAKETNIKNIGVESHMMLPEIQEKAKKTNLEKYGVEFLQQSKAMREKSKQTLIKKYGFNHISKTEHFQSEFKKTCLENNGTEYPMQSNIIREKSKQTLLKNYGVDNPSKSVKIKNIIKSNNLEKYGVDHTSKLSSVKEKLKQTLLENYGVDNIMKNDLFRKKFNITNNENYIKYVDNNNSLFNCDLELNHTFLICSDNYQKRIKSNIPLCTICYPISDQSSIKEKEILRFISENYKNEIISGHRDELEIDIFIPSLKIGFEFNGLYWHSEIYKDKNYHLSKTNFFKEKGIRIIHIWEDDWDNKKDIIKSQILNFLNLTKQKIFARKCEIKEIADNNIIRNFLNNNHIQGYAPSVLKIGLFHNNELVSLMTFDKREGRKKLCDNEWNLARFCNKLNTNIVGSASKLFSYFIKKNTYSRIISYADKNWSVGNLYYKLGFTNIGESSPDHKYVVDGVRKHKQNYKKSNLNINENQTEGEYMNSNGYNKIWDCGKIKFEIKI